MKIFVTGASGFVGSALIETLTKMPNHEVKGLVRRPSPPDADGDWQPVVGDITNIMSFKNALKGIDVIIHAAGRAHLMNDPSENPLREFLKVNTGGTMALARAAEIAGIKRLIFLSSIKVNGEKTTLGRPFNENSLPRPVDCYGVSKHEAEMQLREFAASSALEVSIIRPTLVYGEGVKGNVHRLRWIMSKGLPLPLASVSGNKRSMVHIDNLVSLIIACVEHPDAFDKPLFASDNKDMSTTEFVTFLAKLDGRSTKQIPVPVWLLNILGRLFARGPEIKRLTGTLQVDIGYTMRALNWKPPRSVGVECATSSD